MALIQPNGPNPDGGLPDILAPGLLVVFCGINPPGSAPQTGLHFESGTNRFWRVLHRAGFTPHPIAPEEAISLLSYGYGLTVAAARPTPGASDLSRSELKQATGALEAKIKRYLPRVIAFLGKPALAAMTGNDKVGWGRQPERFGGAEAWVLPNPSGRNRNFSFDALVRAYADLKHAIEPSSA